MGTFVGHMVPGLALILLGLWHNINTIKAYFLKGKSNFHSKFWYPFNHFTFKFKYLELVLLFSFSIFSITMQILEFYNLKPSFMLDSLEHATMFVHLAIYAGTAIVIELTHFPELFSWLLGVLAVSVFSQEFFLLHVHSTDHVGLEGHYHWLLQVIVIVSAVSAAAMTSLPNSVLPPFVLSLSVLFQGCWFVNMGCMLWVPWFVPKGCLVRSEGGNDMHGAVICMKDEAFQRATGLANLQFSLILAGIMIVTASLSLILARKCMAKRQSIEYERLHSRGAEAGSHINLNGSTLKSGQVAGHFSLYECSQP